MIIPRVVLSQLSALGVQTALDRLRQAAASAIAAGAGKVKVRADDTTEGFLSSKLVAGANILINVLNPGGDEQIEIVASGAQIVWDAAKTWDQVYSMVVSAGGSAIVIVPNDGAKEMTPDPAGPTDLSEVLFIGIPDVTGAFPVVDIDSVGVGGFSLGGNGNLQSKDIAWQYYYQIRSGQATWTFDGGSFSPGADSAAALANSFHLVLRNGATIDGSALSAAVIDGITFGCNVQMLSGAAVGSNLFGSHKTLPPYPGCFVTQDASSDFGAGALASTVPGGSWIHAPTTWLDDAARITYDDAVLTPGLGPRVAIALDTIKGWLGKVLVSPTDPTNMYGYLSGKIAAGAGILLQVVNVGVNEQLEVSSAGKARVSATDPQNVQDFLASKIVAGAGILIQILNPGVNEQLQITLGAVGGSGFTPEGGFYVTMINDTGAASVKGSVIDPSTTVDSAGKLVPVGENDAVGVVYDNGVANGQPMRVVVGGWADVLFAAGQTIQREWWVGTNPGPGGVDGQAISQASAPATTDHFKEIGHCFQTLGVVGVPTLGRCVLHFN
jgi:hypothetical protein